MAAFDDGHRPHRFPLEARLEEVIAWKCQACGTWVREFGPQERDNCPVDWRNEPTPSPTTPEEAHHDQRDQHP